MAQTYEEDALEVYETIKEDGAPVTFYTEAVAGGVDPNTGMPTTGTPRVEKSGHGLVSGFKAGSVNDQSIQRQDAYVLYVGEKPEIDMYFNQDGRIWQVKYIDETKPTTTAILYKVQIR